MVITLIVLGVVPLASATAIADRYRDAPAIPAAGFENLALADANPLVQEVSASVLHGADGTPFNPVAAGAG